MFKKRRLNSVAMSLIEIMISMAIGSIVLTSVFMIFYFANKSNTLGFQRMEAQQSLNTTLDILLKDLRNTGYKVSASTCGMTKEEAIAMAKRTELVIYGDFVSYPTEDPKVSSTTLIERVHYNVLNNNTCLLRTIYEESPDNTWTKKTSKVLIGNNVSTGKSRVCLKRPLPNEDFGFCLKYFTDQGIEITPTSPGVNVDLPLSERQRIRKINISINIVDIKQRHLTNAVTSTGLLRNLLTSSSN